MNLTTKLSLLLFCSITALTNAAAQSSDCRISYAYDAAGNRIRRSFNCDATPHPWDNTDQQTHKLLSGLNPNPTSGFVTGTFYEPVSSAFIEVNSMEGISMATLTLSQLCSSFTMDLSALIPGTYIVTIRVPGLVEGYTLIRM